MSTQTSSQSFWFVGATFGKDDQTARFLNEGIWENGYEDKYHNLVKSMRPGEKIAIKAAYTRKHDLPFNNRGHTVSVMSIKAIGIITENLNDGKHLRVDWSPLGSPKVQPTDWFNQGLIDFAFSAKEQDIDRFRNFPFWRERFGDESVDKSAFVWCNFFEAVADKLLSHKDDRTVLVEGMHKIADQFKDPKKVNSYLTDHYQDGTSGPLKDICPFTVIGMFNRGLTVTNRRAIAGQIANLLGVSEPVPFSFDGIPVLNPQKSWFFSYEIERKKEDIDNLWDVFASAIHWSSSDDEEERTILLSAYDHAIAVHGVAWNLSTGLYWIRPWSFPTLDKQSRAYIKSRLGIPIKTVSPQGPCDAETYLSLQATLEKRFEEQDYPIHSFPELSFNAWSDNATEAEGIVKTDENNDSLFLENTYVSEHHQALPFIPYTVDDILIDGCFLDRDELIRLIQRFKDKKNLILQGPPGTGKTWLAKRLAYALIGEKSDKQVRAVQFHPNLSYEDFVIGMRPSANGLVLQEGVFLEAVDAA